ncbi:putative membrane protein, clustering with actp [hydrocarbon metagenome]|uniref:Putative membrane protein, clustering with actp n=1 Tax=hydrocarbon metagenome TaxID=938273 RepID=A0A0W8FY56_9ZZZZ
MGIKAERVTTILNSEKFKDLVKKRLTVSITLTVIILVVYFGFILTIAFYKEFLAIKIGEHLTLGLPIGIGVIIFAWLLTGIYTRWANRKYDKAVRELRNEVLED